MKNKSSHLRLLSMLLSVLLLVGIVPIPQVNGTTTIDAIYLSVISPDYSLGEGYYNCYTEPAVTLSGEGYSLSSVYDDDVSTINGIRWINSTTSTDKIMYPNIHSFEEGNKYSAVLYFEAEEGYEFKRENNYITQVKCYVNGNLLTGTNGYTFVIENNARKYVAVRIEFGELSHTRIPEIDVINLDAPADGNHPDVSATPNPDLEHYTDWKITSIMWHKGKDNSGTYMDKNATFEDGTYYTVEIFVQANRGFRFETNIYDIVTTTTTVGSEEAEIIYAETNGVGYGFTKTYYVNKTVSDVHISGIKKPVAGETVNYEYTYDTTKGYYVDTITWDCEYPYKEMSPGEKFEAGKEYTVKLAIRPKDGYSLKLGENEGELGINATINGIVDDCPIGGAIYGLIQCSFTVPEAHTCTPAAEYSQNNKGHWKNCSVCGEMIGSVEKHIDNDSTMGECDICGHTFPHVCTPSAWIGTATGHRKDCTVCGKNMKPEQEHSNSDWQKDSSGHWKYCTVCNTTTVAKSGHIDSAWQTDASGHWKHCTACGITTVNKASHLDSNGDEKCDACLYGMPNPVETKLLTNNTTDIAVDHSSKIITVKDKNTVKLLTDNITNEYYSVKDKDGNDVNADKELGTGTKVLILDKKGNTVSEYTVFVAFDVDGNGRVQAKDARLALRTSVELETLTGIYFTAADTNSDSKITATDARKILRYSVGLD